MDQEKIDQIIKLRKQRKNYRQVGKEVRCSPEWVRRILADNAPELLGDLLYPELDQSDTFEKPDEVIALELNLPVSTIAAIRRRWSVGNRLSVNLARRRKSLARTLFNTNPGPNFIDFLVDKLFPQLTSLQKGLMENFYIHPADGSPASINNIDSNRGYRTEIKAQLAESAKQFDKSSLLKEGVLKNARSRAKSN